MPKHYPANVRGPRGRLKRRPAHLDAPRLNERPTKDPRVLVKRLRLFVSHRPTCDLVRCGYCRGPQGAEIHYSATVDAHTFEPGRHCTCRLDRYLKQLEECRDAD